MINNIYYMIFFYFFKMFFFKILIKTNIIILSYFFYNSNFKKITSCNKNIYRFNKIIHLCFWNRYQIVFICIIIVIIICFFFFCNKIKIINMYFSYIFLLLVIYPRPTCLNNRTIETIVHIIKESHILFKQKKTSIYYYIIFLNN